jgi:hypothetical protein
MGFSNKVFKGFATYDEAHRAWHAFVNHKTLPPDVLISLFGRPPPLPPTVPQSNIGGLADLLSPSPSRPLQTPLHALASTGSASDAEDFWVVLTGISPGVYQGR